MLGEIVYHVDKWGMCMKTSKACVTSGCDVMMKDMVYILGFLLCFGMLVLAFYQVRQKNNSCSIN